MLRVLIVEDEELAAIRLSELLTELDPSTNILHRTESVEATVSWLQTNSPDLIFLDIHLSDGTSFEVFDQVQVKAPVIFTTAYDQYAIRAFQTNGIGYLLKPFEKSDLEQALEKFRSIYQAGNIDYAQLAQAMQQSGPEYRKRFMVYSGDKIQTIEVERVSYFMAEQKAVFLYSQEGKRYLVDFSLDKLENMLDPEQFFRINRQFILSLRAIRMMYSYSKGRVKIDLEPPSPKDAIVSVDRSGRFKSWLNR